MVLFFLTVKKFLLSYFPNFMVSVRVTLRLFCGKSFIWFCLDILKQILWGILFGSASRVNWDKLTVSEMVQDIESVGQRDWFICHVFWVYGLEIITL